MKTLLSAGAAAFLLTCTLLVEGVAASPAPAAKAAFRATPPAAPAANTEKAPLARYQLKNKSSFALVAGARPPFWPIGWVKRKGGAPIEVAASGPKYTFDGKNFVVTSILLGPPALAVVNGRAYEEGQFLRTPRSGVTGVRTAASGPRVRVHRIADGQVWLQCDEQIIHLTLKRPELNERKPEEELLNEEREEDAPVPAVSKR